ncbi:MAG: hypothetical protein ACK4MD_01570, partial [Demequina sp.]
AVRNHRSSPGAGFLVLMSAVAKCGFDGCGDTGDDPALAVVFLLLAVLCLVSPVLLVPWVQSKRVKLLGAALTVGVATVVAAVAFGALQAV